MSGPPESQEDLAEASEAEPLRVPRELCIERTGRGWRFTIESSGRVIDKPVWFFVDVGGMSGGTFMTPDEARELGQLLISAADESER